MARIVVVGGTGYLGSRVVKGLQRAGADVAAASRRGTVPLDAAKPETFPALEPFDVVVDLSDTVTTPPDALIAWCLERGKTVIEATSDSGCVERLFHAHRQAKGRLVLGGGLFTGVSNLLARDAATRAGAAEEVTFAVSSSPFSGAGTGTIALMVQAMAENPVRYVGGRRVEENGLQRGPTLDFGGTQRPTGLMPLAEAFMLAQSTGAKTVQAYFAPRPAFLVPAFTLVPAWLARKGWYQALMRAYFTVLRKVLLRSVETGVELLAIARGRGGTVTRFLKTDDGMEAGGFALAAMVESIAATPGGSGVRFIDDVTALEPIVARTNALAGAPLLALSEVSGAPARGGNVPAVVGS